MNAPKCWRIFECRSMIEHDLFYLFHFLFHSRCRAMVSVVVIPSMAGHDKPTMQSNNGFFSLSTTPSEPVMRGVAYHLDYTPPSNTLQTTHSICGFRVDVDTTNFLLSLCRQLKHDTTVDCTLHMPMERKKLHFVCLFISLSLSFFSLRSSACLSE